MTSRICIFEDQNVAQFLPLVYVRPVYDLRCGMTTLREKIQRAYAGVPVTLHCRKILTDVVRLQNPEIPVNGPSDAPCLCINGRTLADAGLATRIPLTGEECLYMQGETVVAARLSAGTCTGMFAGSHDTPRFETLSHLPRREYTGALVSYPWELVNANGSQIVADVESLDLTSAARMAGTVYPGAHLINPGAIAIGEGTIVKPGVVLDAEQGPIVIGRNVRILPNAVIEGPAWIGDGTIVKIGAKLYENTSIGPVCKIGGEVECSILHGYANKQHEGFLGHAYLCPWVNLGADTNNSDLKNNYGSVRVIVNGKEIDSGSLFVGLIMGDHAKSGINTMFNTGTVVGIGANVFGPGYPPKAIPSFSWGGAEGLETYDLRKCIGVARTVMGRRNVALTPAEERLLEAVFGLTAHERAKG